MEARQSTGTLISASLLGTLAVAGVVSGALFVFAAAVVGDDAFAFAPSVTGWGPLLIGLLLLGYAALAASAARLLWIGRPAGRLLGVVVGIVALLAATAGVLLGEIGESAPLLWIAAGLGVATVAPLLQPQAERGTT